jgi:hypothetical protein
MLKDINSNDKRYSKDKHAMDDRFFHAISHSIVLRPLAALVDDGRGKKTYELYLVASGAKSERKYEVLNACLKMFAVSFVKKEYDGQDLSIMSDVERASMYYQPGSYKTYYARLFAQFKTNGIVYESHDFVSNGGFHSFYKLLFKAVAPLVPDFGNKPFAATFDAESAQKMRDGPEVPLEPFRVYDDLLKMMITQFTSTFGNRGQNELYSLCFHHVELGITSSGQFKGRKYVKILPRNDEKMEQLSLNKPTFIYNDENSRTQVENPLDKWCIVKLVWHYVNVWCPPEKRGSSEGFFRREITVKEKKVRLLARCVFYFLFSNSV